MDLGLSAGDCAFDGNNSDLLGGSESGEGEGSAAGIASWLKE